MLRLLLVAMISGALSLRPGAARGQSDPFEQFKVALSSGDNLGALELITSGVDTSSKSGDYLTSKVRSVVDRELKGTSKNCAEGFLDLIHTKALIGYSSDANVVLRKQQELSALLIAQYDVLDRSCRAEVQQVILEEMNALPSYAGAVGTTYMELFPHMEDEEVVSFLSGSKWVLPMRSAHERLMRGNAGIPLERFFLESMVIVGAVSYAGMDTEHSFPEMPGPNEYVKIARNLAQQAMRSTAKETRRYSSLFALSYMMLMSDETVAKAAVSEETFTEDLRLMMDIMSRFRSIDLPKPLRSSVEGVSPMYYSAFLRVYLMPYNPDSARAECLGSAELIAKDEELISSLLGPCVLANAVAVVRSRSLMYNFQVAEGSQQLLDLFAQSDSISISCASDLDSTASKDTWSAFQNCFLYSAALGEYQACAAMMAITTEELAKDEFVRTREPWMDFMLTTFAASIRQDTIMNSLSATRHLFDFVRLYVTGKASPYTDPQALFVLLHLAKVEDILAEPVEGRCALVERISTDVSKYGASKGIGQLVQLLLAECRGQDEVAAQTARDFVAFDHGDALREAQIYAYSILFEQKSVPKKRSDYDRFIKLNEIHYGACHRYTVQAVNNALSWYSGSHRPAEVKQLLDELFARYFRPQCQPLISWLPAFIMVSDAVRSDLALKAILDVNMRDLFSGIHAEDCVNFEEKEAFVEWKNSTYTNFIEAEANARVCLVVLNALHGGNEQAWFNETTPYVRGRYRRSVLLTYSTLCSAFNVDGDVRPDSLCRYALLMEEMLRKEPSLAAGYSSLVQYRLDECEAARGFTSAKTTALLTEKELIAMDAQRFNSYVLWYGERIQDTVMSIRLRWQTTDREALGHALKPKVDQQTLLLDLARQKSSLSAYCNLLRQWASWTPSTVQKDHLLSVLESIYERYPELGGSRWNVLSVLQTNTDRSIILQDRFQKYVPFDYPFLDLIALMNSIVSSDLWISIDGNGRSVLCKEVLDKLSGYAIKNENEASAWLGLAHVAAVLIIEEGKDAQVREMREAMSSRMKPLQHFDLVKEGTLVGREYQLYLKLLSARLKPRVLDRSLERSILELMDEARQVGEGVDVPALLRSYAAVLRYHPEVVENSDILTQGLEWLSNSFWFDYFYKDERFMSRDIQFDLHAFWKVVRASIKNRDSRRPSSALTTMWAETLWLQSELLGHGGGIAGFEEMGFNRDLYNMLVTAYWSYPDSMRKRPDEFTKISAIYAAYYSAQDSVGANGACPTKASVDRYWGLISATGQQTVKSLQTKEALTRYAMLGCDSARAQNWSGMAPHADTWLRFPIRTAILEFVRDEEADVYHLRIRTEDTMNVQVLGSIEAIEESWRKWATEMESGEWNANNTTIPSFWYGVVRAASMDTTIKQYVLVPDGIYYNVNPTILPLEKTGQVRVDVVVDLDTYLRPKVPTNRIGSVVLVGGLDYGGKQGQRFALADRLRSDDGLDQGGSWVDLPSTEREVDAIADKLRLKHISVDLITGKSATTNSLQELAFPQAMHFATHGFVDRQGKNGRSSGLVLSGANTAGDAEQPQQSYLYAEDISELDLFACDLVVLSACRTALSSAGQGQGEIIKAFKKAGVSKVIASSWAVPDECTSLLMEYFYDYYLSGVSASQALAEAQRKVAIRFPNKRDWAAFMVYE